jgi:hypothetical protein
MDVVFRFKYQFFISIFNLHHPMQRTLGPFFILALPIQHVLLPMIGKEEFEASIKIVHELDCSLFIGSSWPRVINL